MVNTPVNISEPDLPTFQKNCLVMQKGGLIATSCFRWKMNTWTNRMMKSIQASALFDDLGLSESFSVLCLVI